jgi:hypothetical protein
MSGIDRDRHVPVLVADGRGQWLLLTTPLRQALDAQRCTTQVVRSEELAETAQLVETASAYKVVIVNLLYPMPGREDDLKPRGLEIIATLRSRERLDGKNHPALVIALLQSPADDDDLTAQATDAGADQVLRWSELAPQGPAAGIKRLAKVIHDELSRRQLIPLAVDLQDSDDPGVLTVIDDVGKPNLCLLIVDLAADLAEHRVEKANLVYVAPGASGAHILRADLTTDDGLERTWLLKLSDRREILMRELENARRVGGAYGSSLIITYLSRQPVSQAGWHAIAMVFAADSVTLRSWLCDPQSADHVPDVLSALFLGRGLAHPYGKPAIAAQRAIDAFLLPPFRRNRVRHAVEELQPLLSEARGAPVDDPTEIVRAIGAFVRYGRVLGVEPDRCPGRLQTVVQHADLHGGNILVLQEKHPQPCVVDLASHRSQHWAMDVARFTTDIVLRCVNPPPESHFWDHWSQWRAMLIQVSRFGEIPDDPGNPSAVSALRWIVDQRAALLPLLDEQRRWQWHLALVEQLLRAACRAELPTPKRVLGLVGAYDQLVLAAEAMGEPPAAF